jgi:hypothetical protein
MQTIFQCILLGLRPFCGRKAEICGRGTTVKLFSIFFHFCNHLNHLHSDLNAFLHIHFDPK